MHPKHIGVQSGDCHATDFRESLISESALHELRGSTRCARYHEKGDCEDAADHSMSDQAKTTPPRAARTTAPTSEIKTSNVMNRRAPALMPLLYVAPMWRTPDTAFIPIAIGTVAWVVAGIVLFVVQPEQPAWLWVCGVGAIAGFGGLIYLNRRARRPGIGYE